MRSDSEGAKLLEGDTEADFEELGLTLKREEEEGLREERGERDTDVLVLGLRDTFEEALGLEEKEGEGEVEGVGEPVTPEVFDTPPFKEGVTMEVNEKAVPEGEWLGVTPPDTDTDTQAVTGGEVLGEEDCEGEARGEVEVVKERESVLETEAVVLKEGSPGVPVAGVEGEPLREALPEIEVEAHVVAEVDGECVGLPNAEGV